MNPCEKVIFYFFKDPMFCFLLIVKTDPFSKFILGLKVLWVVSVFNL